ncbi:SPASM domain-containing protein [Uliginosibacterium sp. 31-16]|uniref:radical SAM protein n=1 Tax=Uliginosibacterium sp. 31-16 TaxID=3068315 RepID=UPI00273F2C80|nr:SPASM domain-containing protein [Uliginosibacterium sp. 31-16]MDP5239377.1 SPASM domain-containing protein [Uliginosibacterium sp. 31-16]
MEFSRNIHLLYVPTLCCNLSCSYCYLGEQTTQAALKEDATRAVASLQTALQRLEEAGVLAFNLSLHGGEVTTLPAPVLDQLFTLVRGHYRKHFDAISALGHKKSAPHIKTNLYKFASLYELLDRHKVSVSASIDLPLAMHAKHRLTRGGKVWLDRTHDNLRLLARYPHAKKISATLCAEHLTDIDAFIADIWFIHRELGFDMNNFNIMFAFGSRLNDAARCGDSFEPVSSAQQMALYEKLQTAFTGTELEEGLRRNWFDEFKPSYCTNAFNCGERFYLLQSDGEVYSCVRGQGIEEFHYGNLLRDPVDAVLDNGARKISAIHQAHGFDSDCRSCGHLGLCHTGCPVVKHQQAAAKSYTCGVQKLIYRDHPVSFPAAVDAATQREQAREYAAGMHPALLLTDELPAPPAPPEFRVPNDLAEAKNTLDALIAADPLLQALYDPAAFVLEFADGELLALDSQLLKPRRRIFTLAEGEALTLHVRRDILLAACAEPVRNTVYLQVLRDTPVVYGDEQRTKQAHLYTYQCYADCLQPSERFGETHASLALAHLLAMHRHLYQRGVANNLFVTTQYLRDYHYQKQRNNAFYHVQAVNLPFQNLEFHYLSAEDPVS